MRRVRDSQVSVFGEIREGREWYGVQLGLDYIDVGGYVEGC